MSLETPKQLVLNLKQQLAHASASSNIEETLAILRRLDKEVIPTTGLLRETKIGVEVAKYKQHESPKVSPVAKTLVRKWKEGVGAIKPKKESEAGRSGSPDSPIASGLPKPVSERPPSRITVVKSPLPSRTSSVSPTSKSLAPILPSPASTPTARRSLPTGTARSSKTDGVKFGDEMELLSGGGTKLKDARVKCCAVLYDALCIDSDASADHLGKIVLAIEECAWEKFDGVISPSSQYKTKMRQLYVSLKKPASASLRSKIVGGDISQEKLVEMSSMDLASEELKTQSKEMLASSLQSVVATNLSHPSGNYRAELAWHAKGR
ncbi:hypothetical protein JCM8547_003454 [Rhodosporidiobolus lusitaniae]